MRSNRAFGGILACYLLVFFGLCLLEAAPKYAAWSDPVNLGPVVNSGFDELLPAISDDELSLFFVSTRPGFGGTDIWVSQRAKKSSPWGIPMNLGSSINTSHNERGVGFSRDGHFMFLVSDRPGGLGGFDIWVSRRIHVNDDFGWQPPVNLGQAVNSSSNDAGPNYFQDDYSGATHLYLASNRPGGLGSYDI